MKKPPIRKNEVKRLKALHYQLLKAFPVKDNDFYSKTCFRHLLHV
jgi:hypothetical protein